MENEENTNEVKTTLNGKPLVIEICKIITLIISFVMMLLFLFAPCLELSMPSEAYSEMLETISQDEGLSEKFYDNYESDIHLKELTVYDIIFEIMSNKLDKESTDTECTMGFAEFLFYTAKYTLSSGSVLACGITTFVTCVLFGLIGCVMIFALVFIGLSIYNTVMLIKNPAKIQSKIYGGNLFWVYLLILILFMLVKIPSVFVWHPVYNIYLLSFTICPLFNVIIAIEIALFITHIVLKIIKHKSKIN